MKFLLLIAVLTIFAGCANTKLENGVCNSETYQCRNSRIGAQR